MRKRHWVGWCVIALLSMAGCQREDPGETPKVRHAPTTSNAAAVSALPPGAEKGRPRKANAPPFGNNVLRRIMGTENAPGPGDPPESEVGLVRSEDGAQPGYTLLVYPRSSRADLLSLDGKVVRSWTAEKSRLWDAAELWPDGSLLITGAVPTNLEGPPLDTERYLMKMDFSGKVRWKHMLAAHGSAVPAPNGNLGVLLFERRLIPEIHPINDTRDDLVAILSPDGEPSARWSIADVLLDPQTEFDLFQAKLRSFPGNLFMDLLGAGSLEWMHQPPGVEPHPVYKTNSVLVSLARQDRVAIIDFERSKLVWTWGARELQGVHDAHLLDNGNILLFDNGVKRRWSRVIEVNPRTDEIVWQYRAPVKLSFFSGGRGTCQRLPNGNTLICSSEKGAVFEVNPDGQTVWRFVTPIDPNRKPKHVPLSVARRYPPDFIEPLLKQTGESAPSP